MKLSVSEEMYELLKWYQSWERLSWEDAEKNRPNPDKHRSIRGWYNNLSADGKFVFKRFLNGDDSVIEIERNDTSMYKLEVPKDKYKQLTLYRALLGTPTGGAPYWKEYIRDWKATLSPFGLTAYYRFMDGDDSTIVVKTEPSPTIKDSLESITDKLDDIGDVIKGVVKNLEKEVIPVKGPEYIIALNEKGGISDGFLYNVPTERYVSKVTFGHVEFSHDLNKAVKYNTMDEANELARNLNENLDKLGLANHGRFMSYRKGEV